MAVQQAGATKAYLCGVERVEVEVQLLGGIQRLDMEVPLRVVALRDLVEKVMRRMAAAQHRRSEWHCMLTAMPWPCQKYGTMQGLRSYL